MTMQGNSEALATRLHRLEQLNRRLTWIAMAALFMATGAFWVGVVLAQRQVAEIRDLAQSSGFFWDSNANGLRLGDSPYQKNPTRLYVDDDIWAGGMIRVGTRLAYQTASATLSANASANETRVTVEDAAALKVGDYVDITLDNGRIHRTTVASISSSVIHIDDALPAAASRTNALHRMAAIDPRGGLELGRSIKAQTHSLIRMFRAGTEAARIGLDASDHLTFMIGGNDDPGLTVADPAAGQVGILVKRNLGGTYRLVQVSMGDLNSGGRGHRVLRVPN